VSFKYFNVKNGLTTGNISLHAANANVQANYFLGNINVTSSANLGEVGNVKITGGTSGYVLSTDGTGNLSWASQGGGSSNISNGNSNVNIATANGNITFSAVGNANIMTITGTGANIDGTLNVSGNANLGNIVVSTGTLTNLVVSGTTNLGNVSNVTITGGSANGYLRTDGSGSLSWNALPTTTVTVDSFNGDGTTTAFTLSVTPTSKAYTTVTVGGVTQYQSSYSVSGTTLTFSSPPPSGTVIEVQTIASGGSATPITINTIGGSAYVGVSSNTTMVAGNVYIVNTSSANLTMTLPASGSLGDSIGIIDGTGNSNTHAITVDRNGGNIMGSATDMVITTPRAGLTMVYYNSTQGWILTQV